MLHAHSHFTKQIFSDLKNKTIQIPLDLLNRSPLQPVSSPKQNSDEQSRHSIPEEHAEIAIAIASGIAHTIIQNINKDIKNDSEVVEPESNPSTNSGKRQKSLIYFALFLSYILVTLMTLPSIFNESYRDSQIISLRIGSCVLWLTVIIIVYCKESSCAQPPYNFIAFLLFSCLYGYIISCFSNQVTPSVIGIESGFMVFLMFFSSVINYFFVVSIKFEIIFLIIAAIINLSCVINEEQIFIAETAVFVFFFGFVFFSTCLIAEEISKKKYTSESKPFEFLLSPIQILTFLIEAIIVTDWFSE